MLFFDRIAETSCPNIFKRFENKIQSWFYLMRSDISIDSVNGDANLEIEERKVQNSQIVMMDFTKMKI